MLDRLKEASTFVRQHAPLMCSVDNRLGRDREPRQVQGQGAIPKWLIALFHDEDEIEIAANAPIAARV